MKTTFVTHLFSNNDLFRPVVKFEELDKDGPVANFEETTAIAGGVTLGNDAGEAEDEEAVGDAVKNQQ